MYLIHTQNHDSREEVVIDSLAGVAESMSDPRYRFAIVLLLQAQDISILV
jgi:hypothetical protein